MPDRSCGGDPATHSDVPRLVNRWLCRLSRSALDHGHLTIGAGRLRVVVTASPVLRLAVAAYLARFKGQSRVHTESDFRGYLTWCVDRELDPFAVTRPHIELYLRWLQKFAGSGPRQRRAGCRWSRETTATRKLSLETAPPMSPLKSTSGALDVSASTSDFAGEPLFTEQTAERRGARGGRKPWLDYLGHWGP